MSSSGWGTDSIMGLQESIGESALYSIHVGEEGGEARYNCLCCCVGPGPLLLLQHERRHTMTKKISARSLVREDRSHQLCWDVYCDRS